MIIPDLTTEQIITAVIFLSVLFLFQLFVRKNKFGLKDKFASKTRIRMVESVKLSQYEQVRIITIDNIDYALFSNKGAQTYVLPLNEIQPRKDNHKKNNFPHQFKSPKFKAPTSELSSKSQIKKSLEPNTDSKMLRAISIARKLSPKVSF